MCECVGCRKLHHQELQTSCQVQPRLVNAEIFHIARQQHNDYAHDCRSHHVEEEDLQTGIMRAQHFDHSITAGEAEVGQ